MIKKKERKRKASVYKGFKRINGVHLYKIIREKRKKKREKMGIWTASKSFRGNIRECSKLRSTRG